MKGIRRDKESELFCEMPMIALQTIATRKWSLACGICGKYLGGWKIQALLTSPISRKSRSFCRQHVLSTGEAYSCVNSSCDEIFCSLTCKQKSLSSGHLIECGLSISDILQANSPNFLSFEIDPIPSGYASEYRKYCFKTNEIYFATSRVITTLLSCFISDSFYLSSEETAEIDLTIRSFLQCFPIEIPTDSTKSVPKQQKIKQLTSDITVQEYLQSFLPSSASSSFSSSSDISIPNVEEFESCHECWLLFNALLNDIGICSRQYDVFLSWELFYYLSTYLLPRHLHAIRPGHSGHSTITKQIFSTPLHEELTTLCLNGVLLQNKQGNDEIKSSQNIDILQVIDEFFPYLFRSPSPLQSTEPSTGELPFISITNGCKLLRLLSLLQPNAASTTTSCLYKSEEENDQIQNCIENGLDALERGAIMFMILLPRCSATAKHSCCPSAHFTFCESISLSQETSLPRSQQTFHHQNTQPWKNLPSSTGFTISVVCLRDYYCTCQTVECMGLCSQSLDGLSICYSADSMALEESSRSVALDSIGIQMCYCFRCCVERNGLESTLLEYLRKEQLQALQRTPTEIFTQFLTHDSPVIYHLLALVYVHMANQQMDLARNILAPMMMYLEANQNPMDAFQNTLLGQVYHALGASYLEQGRWQEAHHIWSRGINNADQSCLGNNYQLLMNERQKMSSYPVYRIQCQISSSSLVDPEFSQKSLQSESHPLLISWPQRALPFPNKISVTYDSTVSSISSDSTTQTNANQSISYQTIAPHQIFASNSPVVSSDECQWIISLAEEVTGKEGKGWSTSRHYAVPTTDIPVHHIPELLDWFKQAMVERFGPLLCAQLTQCGFIQSNEEILINVHDAFVVKYDSGVEISEYLRDMKLTSFSSNSNSSSRPIQRLLPLHCDQSSHSFVIALNSPISLFQDENQENISLTGVTGQFIGGGTYFPAFEHVINADIGQITSFAGGHIVHGGVPVMAGVRYILPVFLFIDKIKKSEELIQLSSNELLKKIDENKLFGIKEDHCEREEKQCDEEMTENHRKKKKQKIDFDTIRKTENTFQFSFSF